MPLNADECRRILDIAKVDGALIFTEPNRIYLTGYASTQAAIAVTGKGAFYFTDKRYLSEARERISAEYEIREGSITEACKLLKKCARVGVEFNMPHNQYRYALGVMGKPGTVFGCVKDVSPALYEMRSVKSAYELGCIEKAQSITDAAFTEILKFIKEGVSETELAARLEYIMQSKGATLAFDTIMAFGENGAKPHAHRSERALKEGDFITMDFGARWHGYCSDMTRTVAFKSPEGRKADVYAAVLEANRRGIAFLRAGVIGKQAENCVREFFKESGAEKNFTHSLGHGVGIDIHEQPYYNSQPLREGQVITVEPGLYFDGDFGIRIEDMVKITQDGADNLTKSDKSLIILK